MRSKIPWCEFNCSTADLVRAVCFGDVYTVAKECGLSDVRYENVAMMPEYRKAHRPVQEQAELIERLRLNMGLCFTACFLTTEGIARR